MKWTRLPLTVLGLLCLPLLAAETDPRILAILHKEQSSAQSFCFSFMHDSGSRGPGVAQKCLSFFAARYFSNNDFASQAKDAIVSADAVSRAHGEFCESIGEYTKPGSFVKDDCRAWNRARAELLVLGSKEGAPMAALSAKIDQVANARRRFCQSVLQGGNAGDAYYFGSRVSLCFSTAANAKASDRAIFLGDF